MFTHSGRRHALIGRAMTKDRETAPWPPFIGELILCAQRKAGASALLCGVETQWVDGGGEHNKLEAHASE